MRYILHWLLRNQTNVNPMQSGVLVQVSEQSLSDLTLAYTYEGSTSDPCVALKYLFRATSVNESEPNKKILAFVPNKPGVLYQSLVLWSVQL